MVPSEKVEASSNTIERKLFFYDTLPACCIPKAIMMETGAIIYEKVYASPQTLPKISFQDK